jgi:hypothetical protein
MTIANGTHINKKQTPLKLFNDLANFILSFLFEIKRWTARFLAFCLVGAIRVDSIRPADSDIKEKDFDL